MTWIGFTAIVLRAPIGSNAGMAIRRSGHMDRWIKIEDEQPPKDEKVLFAGMKGSRFLGYYSGKRRDGYGRMCHWGAFSRSRCEMRSVLAWAPILPEYIDEDARRRFAELEADYMYRRRSKGVDK